MKNLVRIVALLCCALISSQPAYGFWWLISEWSEQQKLYDAYRKKDYATIKEHLTKELVNKPYDPVLNYKLGTAQAHLKEHGSAHASFKRAADISSKTEQKILKEHSYVGQGAASGNLAVNSLGKEWRKKKLEEAVIDNALQQLREGVGAFAQALELDAASPRALRLKKQAEKLIAELLQKKQQQKEQEQQDNEDDKDQDDKENQDGDGSGKDQKKSGKDNKKDKKDKEKQDKKDKNKSDKKDDQDKKQNNNKDQDDDQQQGDDQKDTGKKDQQDKEKRDKERDEQKKKDKQEGKDNQKDNQSEEHSDGVDKSENKQSKKDNDKKNKDKKGKDTEGKEKKESGGADAAQQEEEEKKQQEAEAAGADGEDEAGQEQAAAEQEQSIDGETASKVLHTKGMSALLKGLDQDEARLQKRRIMIQTKGNAQRNMPGQKPW